MVIDLPNGVHVAVKNSSDVPFYPKYDGKEYAYPPGRKVTIVPFAVAHHHFGFELDGQGRIYRNTAAEYEDGEETAYYSARANLLPWGWEHDENPIKRGATEKRADLFAKMRDAFENGITGKLIQAPREISEEQFEKIR
jgi:hypothetical protein